jgi:hypothetical protein
MIDKHTKIFTVAHVSPGLEQEWLQHLRDFDTANPGCHFEVLLEPPGASFAEIVDMLRVSPGLPLQAILDRVKSS